MNGSNRGVIVGIIIVVIVVIAGLLIWSNMSSQQNTVSDTTQNSGTVSQDSSNAMTGTSATSDTSGTNQDTTGVSGSVTAGTSATIPAPKTVTVNYTSAGFSPASITINKGDTVKFVNNSTDSMWVASDPHPAHTDYPGFDELSSAPQGGSYSFTFNKIGTWGYHNHRNSRMHGTVVVQ
jgi:plastocyanin